MTSRGPVGGGHAQDHLRRAVVEEPAVATDDEGLACRPADGVEDALHEVFKVVRLHEDARLLAQAGCAGLLTFDGPGCDGMHGRSS